MVEVFPEQITVRVYIGMRIFHYVNISLEDLFILWLKHFQGHSLYSFINLFETPIDYN